VPYPVFSTYGVIYPSVGFPSMGYAGYPGGVSTGDPFGGYLSGAARVIDAQGQYQVNTQQAFQIQEQTRKLQLDNRRRAFDEWLYERAQTPTLNDERERQHLAEVRRDLDDPPRTEIVSGKVLNTILSDLQELEARDLRVPNIPLNEELLGQVNVHPAQGTGNVGLLKEKELSWPVGLRILAPALQSGPLRHSIGKLLSEAKEQAGKGRVRADVLRQLSRDVGDLRRLLRQRVDDLLANQYLEAKRFLADLDGAIQALGQPDAKDYIDGKYAAKGRTVQELVHYLTDNGLRFGPASQGQEAAYLSLYQALATYGRRVRAQLNDK
jgi:hypothetical protein